MPAVDSLYKLKMLIVDAEGVLTDGMTWQDPEGAWRRYFSVRDGIGLRALRKAGIAVAILAPIFERDLLDHLEHSGVEEFVEVKTSAAKTQAIEGLCAKYGVARREVALITHDVEDVELVRTLGGAFTLPSAHPALRAAVSMVTVRQGGDGAVLEVSNHLLQNHQGLQQAGASRSARAGRSATA